MDPENKSFMDRNTLIAVVLVGAIWLGWSKWVEVNYPSHPQTVTSEEANQASKESVDVKDRDSQAVPHATDTGVVNKSVEKELVIPAHEIKTPIETARWSGFISSFGMSISGVTLKQYESRDNQPIVIGRVGGENFATRLIGESRPLNFDVKKISDTVWEGVATRSDFSITKRIELIHEGEAADRALHVETTVSGNLANFSGLETVFDDNVVAPESSSFLSPAADHFDWFVRHEDTKSRTVIDPSKVEDLSYKVVYSAAISSRYFTAAIADLSSIRPEFSGRSIENAPKDASKDVKEARVARAVLIYKPIVKSDNFKTSQVYYVGAKDVKALRAANVELEKVIDYGMFAVLADPLLWLMRFFYGWFSNWGFAIIGLTIVVRSLVLPFNIYSFRSMKAMQVIQPQMKAVREKYKEDPKRMNEEVMKLMKENKANPLSGCLPNLLQLPVFFALYQVLAASIDLYKQPFVFWISDLSVKDPFYVLPILMGVAMFLQQTITPVADPQQAKIMRWMPLIFSFMMISLPSGLTLYIFISTLFGILQQYVMLRSKPATQTTKNVHPAKA